MRLYLLLFLIFASLEFGVAFADDAEVLLSCDTEAGKALMVTHDQKTDVFQILYGKDLQQPEHSIRKVANDMGTSYTHHAAESTDTREIYSSDGQEFTTVGYMDKGGVISAYYILQTGVTKLVDDKCAKDSLSSAFDFSEHFVNMTEVD